MEFSNLAKPQRARLALSAGAAAACATIAAQPAKSQSGFEQALIMPFALGLLALAVSLLQTWRSLLAARAESAESAARCHANQRSLEQFADIYADTVKRLALALDAQDVHTQQRTLRVQKYAVAMAERLGITGVELEAVSIGALLQDIGRLGVPEHVLMKAGRLTEEERSRVMKHALIAEAILQTIDFPWPVIPAIRHHHERWDGSGYPEGLCGEEIPVSARILAVADVYDALTSSRPYREAWTNADALAYLREHAGTQFDPAVVDAFLTEITDLQREMSSEGFIHLPGAAPLKRMGRRTDEATRDIQHASAELWALYQVSHALAASTGIEETLALLASKLETVLAGVPALILLNHESDDSLVVRAAAGWGAASSIGRRTAGDDSLTLRCTRKHEAYCGPIPERDIELARKTIGGARLRSVLTVPLAHNGESLGAINLYSIRQAGFDNEQRDLVTAIAQRAALAIYNGLLFDRTRDQSRTDPLTGLYNVRHFTAVVDERCEAAQKKPAASAKPARSADQFALLCLDLDNFKPVNDRLGHQAGDRVLCEVSRILRSTVREGDVVSRYGGDEFLICLHEADAEVARSMAQRLENAIASYSADLDGELGISIGFACFPTDARSCAALLSTADSRMYAHKASRKLAA